MKVFVTYGRDRRAKSALDRMLDSFVNISVDRIDFEMSKRVGDGIFEVIEREASQADVAIILATPDDQGSLVGAPDPQARARENVWIELGYFWALLGRDRTLLLCKEGTAIPSNFHGVIAVFYKFSPTEVKKPIQQFLEGALNRSGSQREVLFVSGDPTLRDVEWRKLHESFRRTLIISGAAMGSVRSASRYIFERMSKHPELNLVFVLVDPAYAAHNRAVFENAFGKAFIDSNATFCRDIAVQLQEFPDCSDRVSVYLVPVVPFFASVVSDGPELGSEMLVQPFAYKPRKSSYDHMRVKLRRRSEDGAYMIYWNSLSSYMEMASHVLVGHREISQFSVIRKI